MHHLMFLRKLSLFLILALVYFGCATNKSVKSAEKGFSVIAESMNEGFVLHFFNIPNDTKHLFIGITDITDTEGIQTHISFFADELEYNSNVLSSLIRTGSLLCPFVKKDHEYKIFISISNDIDGMQNDTYILNVIAGGGIYITNNPTLKFMEENTIVVLSEVPLFSEEVTFSPIGFLQFSNFVLINDERFGGGYSHWNDLSYPAREVLNSTQEHFGFTGNFPVDASVNALLIHENLEWSVAVAKADDHVIMLF